MTWLIYGNHIMGMPALCVGVSRLCSFLRICVEVYMSNRGELEVVSFEKGKSGRAAYFCVLWTFEFLLNNREQRILVYFFNTQVQ